MKMKTYSKGSIASDVAIFKNWMERGNSSNVLNTNETVCPSILGSLPDDDNNENGKKAMGLDKQNNDSAHASRIFVHFSAVVARPQRENA